MITVYGIPHCDTVKKARAYLTQQGIDCVFHDFKKNGVPAEQLSQWLAAAGWETLLNRKGTTWRKLDAATQAQVTDTQSAAALMVAQPSVIKRPVVDWATEGEAPRFSVGFDAKSAAEWVRNGLGS